MKIIIARTAPLRRAHKGVCTYTLRACVSLGLWVIIYISWLTDGVQSTFLLKWSAGGAAREYDKKRLRNCQHSTTRNQLKLRKPCDLQNFSSSSLLEARMVFFLVSRTRRRSRRQRLRWSTCESSTTRCTPRTGRCAGTKRVSPPTSGASPTEVNIYLKSTCTHSNKTEKLVTCMFYTSSYFHADVVKQAFQKNQPASRPCSEPTRFTFEWPSLAKALSRKPLQLESLYLRAYVLVNQETVRLNEKLSLTVTVSLYGEGGRREIGSVEIEREMVLSRPSDQWIEVDLSEEARKFWHHVKTSSEIRISIEVGAMDCYDRISSPVNFYHPAELPPPAKHRDRSHQPFLLVFTTDNHLPQKQRSRVHNADKRSKRSPDNNCARYDHSVNFSKIGLTDVLVPISINIGKCSGSCSESTLRGDTSLGTNHARIMSTIKTIQDYSPNHGLQITSDGPASTPCCVPDSFDQRTALYMRDDSATLGIRRDYYKDLVIASCSCQ